MFKPHFTALKIISKKCVFLGIICTPACLTIGLLIYPGAVQNVSEFMNKKILIKLVNTTKNNSSLLSSSQEVQVHPMYTLTVPASGRLGNQMFQYASLLGIAHINHRTVTLPLESLLRPIFILHEVGAPNFKETPVIFETDYATYDEKFEHLPETNCSLMQYLQSWKYFHFLRETILKEFTFKPHIVQTASSLMGKYAKPDVNVTKVGIHVRRGDYLYVSKRDKIIMPTKPYFIKAANLMKNKYSNAIFIVVSDDNLWCKQEFTNIPDIIIAEPASPEVHLALLASCDHVIISTGTFGWWGGYLAGGDVVYFKEPLEADKKTDDFYLPSWISMGN